MRKKRFDKKLSLRIDALHQAIEEAKAKRQANRVKGLRKRLALAERAIP